MGEKNKNSKANSPGKMYTDGPELDLSFLEDDEEEVFIDYVCVDCGCEDPVPEFVVAECAYDLKAGEHPEYVCPECNGTLVRKQKPAEE